MSQTLDQLIEIAAEHADVRHGTREAKLAALIAAGLPSFGENPVFPELDAVVLTAGANDAVPMPESGLLMLTGHGGKSGGDSVLCGISGGTAGRLLLLYNTGPFEIEIDSSFGSPASEDQIFSVAKEVDVYSSGVSIGTSDVFTFQAGELLLLLWNSNDECWSAISPAVVDGVADFSDLTAATAAVATDVANAKTTLVTDSVSTGTVNDLPLPAGGAVLFNNATAPTITGIAGGTSGRQLTIINGSGSNLTIEHQGAGSLGSNQIIAPGVTMSLASQVSTPDDAILLPGQAITLIYGSNNQWYSVSPIARLIP